MGIFSTSQTEDGALEEFYSRFIGKFMATKSGGNFALEKNSVASIAALGGYSGLEDYGNSVYSEAKEKLIRGIAKDISSMLKVTSSYADTADIKDVVSKLQRIVPDPKHNKGLKADSAVHKELCMALAKSINKQYDMKIIDSDAEPSIVCNKVSEIMYSLFAGLHTEFLTISGDVHRILKNLQILQEYVDSANTKLIDNLEKSQGSSDGETESIKALYTRLSEEISRQQAILSNLTSSVIGPVGESLINILEDNDDFAQLTTDLKKMTGTPEFGTKLSYLLSGTSGIASAAEIVDKALKKIGMSVSEYKSVHGLRELREKVYRSMVERKPSSEELNKLLIAADMLYKNDLAHDDIVAYLEKKKGGVSGGALDLNDSFADAADIATDMTNTDGPFKGRTQSSKKSMVKQISEQNQLRKQLFIALNLQIKHNYDKIKFSLSHIGKKIGGEIDVSPELDVFIRQLNNFSNAQPDKQNIHIALSGYRTDINSLFVKYQFIENLYAISESADALVNQKGGVYFKEIKSCVETLLKAVTDFTETFGHTLTEIRTQSLGAKGGVQIDKFAEMINGGEASDDDTVMEGDSKSTEVQIYKTLGGVVGTLSESDFEHFKTIKRSIREIDYYYRIASIKHNMEVTSGEYAGITENYENILGEEAGYTIDQIQKKYNDLISSVESNTPPQGVTINLTTLYINDKTIAAPVAGAAPVGNALLQRQLFTDLKEIKDAAPVAPQTVDGIKKIVESYEGGYKFLLEYIRSSKIEMLEAAQALDLYLSKFTQSIQFKPDQIKEFVQILEQIEIVAKWFTDKSGDNLVGVFEAFSSATPAAFPLNAVADLVNLGTTNATNVRNPLTDAAYTIAEDHYYETLAADPRDGAGKFYQPRMMTRDQAINFVKQIEKSIKSVRALENIIATFSRINTSVSSDVKTFMSSGLMFKAFMKYCVASVISVGYLSYGSPVDVEGEPATKTIIDGFVVNNYKSAHAKMAVGLRFNNDAIKWTARAAVDTYLELCDPLSIYTDTNKSSNIKNVDFCDNIFDMCIKSMIAKVFTVVGSYTLFNKPAKDQMNSFSMSTNPLRQILGGSSGGAQHDNIIPEATELYIRLPLLVEWYRTVFEFNSNTTAPGPGVANQQNPNPLISMIPDMDSVWGPLCKVIFLDGKSVVDGAYPAEYAHKIIDSITNIYKYYAVKKLGISTKEIIEEFVLEINRRYGFIMREEIQAYLNERDSYLTINEAYPDDERVEYDLVDIDDSMGRRMAPSDKFRTFSKGKTARKYDAMDLLKSAKRFRNSIEANLALNPNVLNLLDENGNPRAMEDSDFRTIADISLNGIITETTKKITNSPSSDEKYMVVHEQLHGVEKFGDLDQQKIILFHETVVTPLTVLYFTYLALNDFNRFCTSLNPGDIDKVYTAPELAAIVRSLHNLTNSTFKGDVAGNKYKQRLLPADVATDIVFNDAGYAPYVTNAQPTKQTMFTNFTMETLLRKVMNVGSDMNGLTEVYFVGSTSANTYPVLNYDKLEETCTELFNNAKLALHQLRKFVPASLVKKYESIETGNLENRISLFYIQEQLFERLFQNKFGNGLVDANVGMKNIYLTMTKDYPGANPVIRQFSTIFSKIGFWNAVDGEDANRNDINGYGDRSSLNEIQLDRADVVFPRTFIQVFKSGVSYGNISKEDSRVVFNTAGAFNIKSIKFDTDVVNVIDNANPALGNVYVGTKNLYDLDDNKIDTLHEHLGFIPKLNNIIYKYCNIFIDKSSKKIYKTLIEKFINGHNAKDIISSKNINDNVYINDNNVPRARVCRTEPKPNAVLFASIANGLKGLMLSQSQKLTGTGSAFIEDNFLNVSEYQKELMRANLPAFEKELNLLVKKSEFMKRCLEETHVQVVGVGVNEAGLVENVDGQSTQANKIPAAEPNTARKPYLISIYNDISMTAKSLIRCIVDTQKELNDTPMYFETYNESIIDYNNRNGCLPFMPVSNVTHLMNFNSLHNGANEELFVPVIGGVDPTVLEGEGFFRSIEERRRMVNGLAPAQGQRPAQPPQGQGQRPAAPVVVAPGEAPPPPPPQPAVVAQDEARAARAARGVIYRANNEAAARAHDRYIAHDNLEGLDALYGENNNDLVFNLSLIPRISMSMGSPEFKFTYGTRGLLHYKQEASLKYAPGVSALLDNYNSKLGGAAAFSKPTMEAVTMGVVVLSRWVLDFMYHNQALDTHNWNAMRNLVLNNQLGISVRNTPTNENPAGIIGNVVQNLTCQTAKNGIPDYAFWGKTASIILMTENDNFKQSVYRFMSGLNNGGANRLTGLNRVAFRIYNILDLNIVPINVHAMQREIPFVNLFNYSYTFNHMIKNFISVRNGAMVDFGGEIPLAGNDDAYTSARYIIDANYPDDTLVRHLMSPLGLRRINEYVRNTYRIMSGTAVNELSRPKYLSDQLWNKVLLNSIYNAPGDLTAPARYTAIIVNNVPVAISANDAAEPYMVGYINRVNGVSSTLSYVNNQRNVTIVIDAPFAVTSGQEGFIRYQSKLVRWTEWFVQLQRVVRLLMRSQLEWVKDPVVQGSDAISEEVTEYKKTGIFSMGDYE
jgi:hypothetical protein